MRLLRRRWPRAGHSESKAIGDDYIVLRLTEMGAKLVSTARRANRRPTQSKFSAPLSAAHI